MARLLQLAARLERKPVGREPVSTSQIMP